MRFDDIPQLMVSYRYRMKESKRLKPETPEPGRWRVRMWIDTKARTGPMGTMRPDVAGEVVEYIRATNQEYPFYVKVERA